MASESCTFPYDFGSNFTNTRFQFEYTWSIPHLKSHCSSETFQMKSPQFSAAENTYKWFLELHTPSYYSSLGTGIRFFLEVYDKDDFRKYGSVSGKSECSIIDSKGQKLKTDSQYFRLDKDSYYFQPMELPVANLPETVTRIYCRISYIHEFDNTTLTSEKHTIEDYGKLFNEQEFSDITIHVGGKKFPCHKNILAIRSSVFKAMLTHEMKEKKLNRIDIDDIDENIFQEVLRYMYTGKVENLETVAFELLSAADKYDLAMLKMMCETALCKMLTTENAVKMVSFSNTYNLKNLKFYAIEFIQANLKRIISSDARVDLMSQPELMMIILEAYAI